MDKTKKYLVLMPLMILLIMACTCGAPGLKDFLRQNDQNEAPVLAPSATPLPKDPQLSQPSSSTEAPPLVSDNAALEFLSSTRFEANDWEYVVGEIKNNSGKTLDYVDISMILYDANNQVLATENVSPLLSPLYTDSTTPFIVSSNSWGEFDHYEFVVNDWYEAEDVPPLDLAIVYHTSFSDDYMLTIVGEIANNSDQTAEWVYVAGGLYDASGQIMNATTAYTMLDTIAPGEKAPFKMYFSDNWKDSTDYYLQVTGRAGDAPVPEVRLVDYKASKEGNTCTFAGTVENLTAGEIGFVSVIVSLYDASDQLVDASWTFSDGSAIPAKGKDTFTLSVYDCKPYKYEVIRVE